MTLPQTTGQIAETLYRLFCELCGRVTDHTEQDEGQWETYTCKECGHKHSYKVR